VAWSRRWRIETPERWRAVVGGLLRMPLDFRRPLELVLRPEHEPKTGEQRGLWHALLADFGAELGYTLPEIKAVVKREYYGAETVTLPSGHKYEVVKSSEDEDRAGYSALIDFTLRFAAEQGVVLQDARSR